MTLIYASFSTKHTGVCWNNDEMKRERERTLILLLFNVCQLFREETKAVCRQRIKTTTTTRNGKKDSQQGHQMSVFNIDSIFSSSVRYPVRYVLKPEIIICRFQAYQKQRQGGTGIVFLLACEEIIQKFRHFCENQTSLQRDLFSLSVLFSLLTVIECTRVRGFLFLFSIRTMIGTLSKLIVDFDQVSNL